MSAPFEVRPARLEEAAAVVPLYEWLFAPPGSRPPAWDPALAEERLAEAIAADLSTVLVAAAEGRLLGLCTAYMDLTSVRYGRRCWVEDLAVDPEERSRGIGAGLLEAALEWARGKGASHLELDSGEERTDAHRFYEREGAGVRSICFGWHGIGR
jgi:GNAT superfamily N-acetyltransferase